MSRNASRIYGLEVGEMKKCHNNEHVFCAFNVKYGIICNIYLILDTVGT